MKIDCADVVMLLTGIMTASVDRVYKLYNGLTGDNLHTHQLPRAIRASRLHARKAFPLVATWLDSPDRSITAQNWQAILTEAEDAFGNDFEIEPLADWQRIHPLAELVSALESIEKAKNEGVGHA